MSGESNNPYLAEQIPGTWDLPFRRWILGVVLPLTLLAWGIEDMVTLTCQVPVPTRGRFARLAWMELNGAGAVWFGLLQSAIAVALHGRFYWRYHTVRWRLWEKVQNAGMVLAAIATVITSVLLWSAHF